MRTAFPSYGDLGTSDVIGRATGRGGDPLPTDGPTKACLPTWTREGPRHPADRDAFHRRERVRQSGRGLLHGSLLRVGPSLTPPTPFPEGEVLCDGALQAPWSTVTRVHGLRETSRLLYPLESPCLGLTTQARQRGSNG